MKTTFQIYKSTKDKNFRWRAIRSGRIVADSAEGYKRKTFLLRSLKRLIISIRNDNFVFRDH